MRLRQRIILPFVTLFVAAYLATALVVISVVAGAVERRLVSQTENLARVLTGFPGLQQGMLNRLEQATGARAFVIENGAAAAGTGTPPPFEPVEGVLQDSGAVYARLGPARALLLAYDPAVVSREKADAVRPIVIVAAAVLGLAALLGLLIAQTIARPLERLAQAARAVSPERADAALPSVGGAEVRDLADALNRMLDAVRRGERLAAMGALSAGVAHEIRNPLSAMKMTVQMLREERPPGAREPYDLLLREIERLELAAGELSAAGPRPLARARAGLDRIADDVLELVRRQLDHLRVGVRRAFEPAPEVDVDVDRLRRVVMNLVLNGAQAMPQGGTLTVSIAPRDGAVRLAVADTGPGIPPELRDRMFEPFVTSKADGVGLGLALTRRIVEDHGGVIGFDTSDRGTTFWIEIPRGDRTGH